jgi:PAS domain S-box-containing protein
MAETPGLPGMAAAVLRTVCETAEWDVGVLWVLDPEAQVLRLLASWHQPDADATAFEAESQRRVFGRGLSLPGRVWLRGGPVYVPDVYAEHGCPRFEAAKQCGLRGAFAFPILSGEETLGVVEFFSREMAEPDEGWREVFASIGSRLGLYLKRQREEESHRATSQNLQALLHSSPLAVVLIDPDNNVSYWNPAAERMFGWMVDEMAGRPYASVVPEEKVAEFHSHMKAVLDGREIIAKDTWRMRKDGSRVPVSVSGAPLRGPRGDVIGAVVMAADLSLRRPAGGA